MLITNDLAESLVNTTPVGSLVLFEPQRNAGQQQQPCQAFCRTPVHQTNRKTGATCLPHTTHGIS